jgi:hypothetical protein
MEEAVKEQVVIGTVRKLGLEGGVWALVTDDGATVELVDPPAELRRDGAKAEIEADQKAVDVTIGMVGRAVRVRSFRLLDD